MASLKFTDFEKNDRVVKIESIKGQVILFTELGKVYHMEAQNVDQMKLQPYVQEITPAVARMHPDVTSGSASFENLPIKTLKKS